MQTSTCLLCLFMFFYYYYFFIFLFLFFRCILSARISFFSVMFSKNWKETTSSTMMVPEDISNNALWGVLEWAYSGKMGELQRTCDIIGSTTFAAVFFIENMLSYCENMIVDHMKVISSVTLLVLVKLIVYVHFFIFFYCLLLSLTIARKLCIGLKKWIFL